MTKHSEITKNQWRCFCDDYTRRYRGWMVNVDAYDPTLAKLYCEKHPPLLKVMVNNLAFQGIVFEGGGLRPELLISLASCSALFTHRIIHPAFILTLTTEAGLHEGLIIHDKTNGVVQIGFCEPARPVFLDDWIGLGSLNRKYTFRLPAEETSVSGNV